MNLKKYKKIAILSGGISNENEISKLSAKAVHKVLKHKYRCKLINVSDDCIKLVKTLKQFKPDVVFNCLHGYFGEDGQIQSLLNFLGLPYTHSGVLPSAIAMNKEKSKLLFKNIKINVPNSITPLKIKLFPFLLLLNQKMVVQVMVFM